METSKWVSAKALFLVAGVVALAGCGGLPFMRAASPTPTPNVYQAALAYSQCMRTHGVPDYPDPDPSGHVTINAGSDSDLNPHSSALQSALNACQSLAAYKGHRTQADKQHLVEYAACMRSHGVPDFPDPVFSSSGAEIDLPQDVDPNSPVFKAADQACRSLTHALGG